MAVSESEVFRFFTLRAPNKVNPSTKGAGFIPPNATIITQPGYVNDLATIRSSNAGNNNAAYAAMLTATQNYQNSPLFYTSVAAIVASYDTTDVQPLANWLVENGVESDVATIQTQIAAFGISPSAFLAYEAANDLQKLVWENLTAQTIIPQSVDVRNYLQTTLKMSNFFDVLENEPSLLDTPEGRNNLINSKVLLPNEIFPVPQPDPIEETPPVNPTTETKQRRIALAVQWHKYHDAIEEIRKKYSCKIDEARIKKPDFGTNNEYDPCTKKKVGDFSNDFSNDFSGPDKSPIVDFDTLDKWLLSPATLETVNEVWCESIPKINVSIVLERLQEKLSTVSGEMVKTITPFTKVSLIGGSLIEYDEDAIIGENATSSGDGDNNPCKVKSLGVADLLIVEQTLKCYKPGEVAHIENILKGEYKDRTTRRLNRKESTFTIETISESESERDVQTTDRFEMQQETSKVVQKDMELHAGVQVSAKFGVAQINTDLGFSMSNSSTQSNKNAVQFGKSVTERARQKVYEKKREEKKVTIIEEFEETNKHGFDNKDNPTGHVVGVYRWVDKIYKAQLKNYGLRTMFQFMIPEPALFHIHAMQTNPVEGLTVEKPKDPRLGVNLGIPGQGKNSLTKLKSAKDITRDNYIYWAAIYGADITPPPDEYTIASKTYNQADSGRMRYAASIDFKVPDGYYTESFWVKLTVENLDNNSDSVVFNIGEHSMVAAKVHFGTDNSTYGLNARGAWWSNTLDKYENELPVTIWGADDSHTNVAVNIKVKCKLTDKAEDEWKLKTFKAIMSAYEEKKAAYDSAVYQLKAQSGIIQIRGNNPLRNRDIEKNELKKGAIQLLRGKKWDESDFSSADYRPNLEHPANYPFFDNCDALKDGKKVLFFEHAFEWDQITYTFYPYFWGAKKRWTTLYTLEDNDPLFTAFLQSGMARVIVPVRPGFEDAVAHYMNTGQIWNGGEVPTLNDNEGLFVSIYDEMRKPVGTPVGDPWEIKLPTNLVILQKNAEGLDEDGLPCYP